jgi:prefoldin alpha subunit
MDQQEIVTRARIVGQQKAYLEKEMERMMLSMLDLNNALSTVKSMKDESGLVPVGGGAFIRATFEGKKVLVPVGANYIIEYNADEAQEEIGRRIKMAEKAVQNLRGEMKKIDQEFARLEKLYRGGPEEEGGS